MDDLTPRHPDTFETATYEPCSLDLPLRLSTVVYKTVEAISYIGREHK